MIRRVLNFTGVILLVAAACTSPGTDALHDDPLAEAMADDDGNAGEPGRPGAAAVDTSSCGSGANGGFHYCSAACPCDAGEGDCDSNGECAPGLTCVKDVGPSYGWDHDVDVCEDTCHPSANGGSSYCSATCPCASGEGDCDSNSECLPGLTCVKNVGASYGWDEDVDVCEGQCDGTGETCAPGCPCAPQGTSLFLQVLALDGQPIPTAGVTLHDSLHVTDGVGRIVFEDLSPGRVVAKVEAYGFAPASVAVELAGGAHAGAEVRLRPLGTPIPFDAGSGAVIEQAAVRVTIPPGSLVDDSGQPVAGTVEATIVPLDPTQATLDTLPGPLQGLAAGTGAAVELESVVMAEVSLWQNGLPVQLAPGATATLEMVLPDSLAGRYQLGERIPAWWLDLDAGVWKEDGAGYIVPSAAVPGQLAWVVEVGHFTWWNCDAPWTDKHCYTVVVQDASGNPVPDMQVSAQGVSYTGTSSWSYTRGDGQECVDIKRDATADILVGRPIAPLVTQRVTGSGPAADCAGNGAACTLLVVTLPAGVVSCTPGASEPCPYSGPAGTEGVGVCQAGTTQCNATGTAWSGCVGQVVPSAETCTSPFDDDCDGETNDGVDCSGCNLGERRACYSGPPDTLGVGICRGGTQACGFTRVFGPCAGEVVPQLERCTTPEDDDCDGTAMMEVWDGDFSAGTFEQLEPLRGCSGVQGSLEIIAEDADEASDLSALDSIQFVDRDLFFYAPQVRLDASVLPSLVTVGGDLNVESNRDPAVFDPFHSLVSVGGTLYLFDITAEVVTGLPALRTVNDLVLDSIEATRIDDLAPNLETIGQMLMLIWVEADSMSGLGALRSASTLAFYETQISIDLPNGPASLSEIVISDSTLQLRGLHSLQYIFDFNIGNSDVQLHGLDSFRSNGSLDVEDSHVQLHGFVSLPSLNEINLSGSTLQLRGLGALQSIGGFKIDHSAVQLEGLDALRFIRSLRVTDFVQLDGLDGLQSIGQLDVRDSEIEQLQGLDAVQSIGRLIISGSEIEQFPRLPSLSSLESIEIVGSNVRMENAFPALTAMRRYFRVRESHLQVRESFQALESVGGGFRLESNVGGEIVDSFDLLGSIDGELVISSTSLSQVPGFPNLTAVGQLVIEGNDALTSLTGFERLAQASGIGIYNNPALDVCYVENLETVVRANGYTGSFEAHDNGPDGGVCE